jgi:hypothetical protein
MATPTDDIRPHAGRLAGAVIMVATGVSLSAGLGAFLATPSSVAFGDTIGKPGVPCEAVEAVFPARGEALSTLVVVQGGPLRCADARSIIGDFLSSGPYDRSVGRYHRKVGEWQCLTQTTGFYPEVARCDRESDGLQVLSLDARATEARGSTTNCGNPPRLDPYRPTKVRANISCRAAEQLAQGEPGAGFTRYGACDRDRCFRFAFGFACVFRAANAVSGEATCSLGDARVNFDWAGPRGTLPFTGRNEITLLALGLLMLIVGLTSRIGVALRRQPTRSCGSSGWGRSEGRKPPAARQAP